MIALIFLMVLPLFALAEATISTPSTTRFPVAGETAMPAPETLAETVTPTPSPATDAGRPAEFKEKSFWENIVDALPSIANWLVYAAIAGVTLIGVFKCLVPLYATTHAMKRAIRSLEEHAGVSERQPIWQESSFMGKRLRGSWLRFLQNAEQLDHRGLPCNVEDYINDDTVTHGPGNAQLAELIPTLLTSLGILGTFMGMVQGLSGLDISNSTNMMEGIRQLLEGMGYAFGTSVAGVSCSLIFNMLNRIAQGASYRAVDEFTESFTQLAMQRPLDNDVQLICQNQDRNKLLGEVTENVSGRMASSIELAVGRALSPVAVSMDRFLMNATQSQIDAVARISDTFVQRMNAALNESYLQLGRTLAEVNRQEEISLQRLSMTLDAAQSITEDVGRLHGVSEEVISGFERYIAELASARSRDERFEQNAVSLLGSMQAAAQDQTNLIAALRREQGSLREAVTQFGRDAAESMEAIRAAGAQDNEELRAIGGDMRHAGEAISESCSAFAQQVEAVSRSLTGFEESIQALSKLMADQAASLPADGTSGETAEKLSAIQTALAGIQQSLEKASAGDGED
ncbi:MAG: MotA/TolQ/ExbB proton channel family protein [Clostridia bacterium]|nr:MotA/TolQ/ExbB proton channel family protein [Clostridia bacterium]